MAGTVRHGAGLCECIVRNDGAYYEKRRSGKYKSTGWRCLESVGLPRTYNGVSQNDT